MKSPYAPCLCPMIFLLLFIRSIALGGLVYDNTASPLSGSMVWQDEGGDTITLAGTERHVIRFSVGITSMALQVGNTDDFQLSFYEAVGVENAPSENPFWQSAWLTDITLTGANQLILFEVPFILVPDTFVWKMKHTNGDFGAAYFQRADPITIGSSPDYAWDSSNRPLLRDKNPMDFMAKVEAVAIPEPTTALLIGAGALLLKRRTA